MDRKLEVWFLRRGTPISGIRGYTKVPADVKFIEKDRLYWRARDWRPNDSVLNA
jgi:hypothetical protein